MTAAPTTATLAIHHDPVRHRFTAEVDGHSCLLTYRPSGSHVVFDHTGVPAALQGRGLAAQLVQAGLDWARSEGVKIDPACSYVRVYLQRHPESQDLWWRPEQV